MIRAIGRYLPMDKDGFLQNDCSWEKVPAHWKALIEEVKKHYLENLGDSLHSIYLRGSIPAGIALDGVADLDTFALVKNTNCKWEALNSGEAIARYLQEKYPFVSAIEMIQSGLSAAGQLSNPHLAAILKLQSVCFWGENILPTLPAFRPGRSLMRNYRWLRADLAALKEIPKQTSELQSILKTVLRTGFELVMEREQQFTSDLYPCWKSFAKYYPEWEEEMKKALGYFLEAPKDSAKLSDLADGLGVFLIQEVERRIEE